VERSGILLARQQPGTLSGHELEALVDAVATSLSARAPAGKAAHALGKEQAEAEQ
jgi:hypothetical protein